ncbi:hypothetical protein BS333_03995 [Vibrio azureus]|uniref:HTH araC/xylS-type domain-containing protein n=1 Tax=Vibrio azureus NBRC 104587 TaxID=1219077 RepID=U3AUH0_9VIBR|nr:AraC family transcriptional regulator [Vibrio azureus]AUI85596.1 hypothetical protein BS333_03995 [Vibrio azureus]GAD77400.1 hypothetical protein VAZ01S_073_00330 [Vibrio azureus NBRC 104587]
MRAADSDSKTIINFEIGKGFIVIASHNLVTEWHQHVAIQITLSMHGYKLQLDTKSQQIESYGFVLASSLAHRLHSSSVCCLTLLVDPSHPDAHHLCHVIGHKNVINLTPSQCQALIPLLISALAYEANIDIKMVASILDADSGCGCIPDMRIQKATLLIDELDEKKISSLQMAQSVYLSESRFLHLFKSKVGTNFRRYLLWRKLQDAISRISTEAPLTHLASNHGFADSAHFSRTCRDMFGLSPSAIRQFNEEDEIDLNEKEKKCLMC